MEGHLARPVSQSEEACGLLRRMPMPGPVDGRRQDKVARWSRLEFSRSFVLLPFFDNLLGFRGLGNEVRVPVLDTRSTRDPNKAEDYVLVVHPIPKPKNKAHNYAVTCLATSRVLAIGYRYIIRPRIEEY